jgi:hypothetical protein
MVEVRHAGDDEALLAWRHVLDVFVGTAHAFDIVSHDYGGTLTFTTGMLPSVSRYNIAFSRDPYTPSEMGFVGVTVTPLTEKFPKSEKTPRLICFDTCKPSEGTAGMPAATYIQKCKQVTNV